MAELVGLTLPLGASRAASCGCCFRVEPKLGDGWRVGMLMTERWLPLCLVTALVVGCSSADPPPPKPPRWLAAPPKPGASLTSSVQCTCRSCEPVGCCEGSEADPGSAECGDGYDFSKCKMSVQSCTGRCYEIAWRVPVGKPCASRQPPDCCADR